MTGERPETPLAGRDAEAAPATPPKHPESLRRELLAIIVLYAAMAVLPFLVGLAWAP